MKRRWFLWLVPAGLWGWRVHVVARHTCARGGVLYLTLKGEPWKLTERERDLIDWIAEKMGELEPQNMQRRLPKS